METILDRPTCPNKDCPGYGQDNRLMRAVIADEIAIKRLPASVEAELNCQLHVYTAPGRTPLPGSRMPAARTHYDMCTKCGQVYTTKIEIGVVIIPLQQNMPLKFE